MKFKNLFTAVLMLLSLNAAFAQNPLQQDTGRLTRTINGRYGIDTNGATAGQAVTFNGTAVVWGAGGGGGFDTNANFIVNGTWRFNSTAKFPGGIYHTDGTQAINITDRNLLDENELESVEFSTIRALVRADASQAVKWQTSILQDGGNFASIKWADRQLLLGDGITPVVDWSLMYLLDSSSTTSVGWDSRILFAPDGFTANVNWSTKVLAGGWTIDGIPFTRAVTNAASTSTGLTVTGQGTHTLSFASAAANTNTANLFTSAQTFNAATVLNSTLNGMDVATFVTNVASSSSVIAITAQGTHTLSLASSAAATNAANLFTSPQTFNASASFKSGIYFPVAIKSADYTATTNDFIVLYRGTSATSITNTLPAINGTTVTNGFTLVIKDGQMGASVTNIVIMPNGSDTVGLSTSKTLNANGQAVNITVDGAAKNWFIW